MRDFNRDMNAALEWQTKLLENKKEVYNLVRMVLPILGSLFEEDRKLYIHLLGNYICGECGHFYKEDNVLPDQTYGCNCTKVRIVETKKKKR